MSDSQSNSASPYATARHKDGSSLTAAEEERGAVQLSADAAVISVCEEKIRESQRERDIAIAERDTAEARVKDLEIRLRDQGQELERLQQREYKDWKA